jgi:hypothetical protein
MGLNGSRTIQTVMWLCRHARTWRRPKTQLTWAKQKFTNPKGSTDGVDAWIFDIQRGVRTRERKRIADARLATTHRVVSPLLLCSNMVRMKRCVLIGVVGFWELAGATASAPWSLIWNQIDQVMLYPPSGLKSAQRALEFGKRLTRG